MNGIDSSVLVFAMDPTTSEHSIASKAILSLSGWALNPTVAHEVYHTLVFKRKMLPEDARTKLLVLINDRRSRFLNITKTVSLFSIDLAAEFNLGGRDALIVGCYMFNGAQAVLTHDRQLLRIESLEFRNRKISFVSPDAE